MRHTCTTRPDQGADLRRNGILQQREEILEIIEMMWLLVCHKHIAVLEQEVVPDSTTDGGLGDVALRSDVTAWSEFKYMHGHKVTE